MTSDPISASFKDSGLVCQVAGCASRAEVVNFGAQRYICRVCDLQLLSQTRESERKNQFRALLKDQKCFVDFESGARRNWGSVHSLLNGFCDENGCRRDSLYANFQETVKKYPNEPFLSNRTGNINMAGPFKSMSYGEGAAYIADLAQGLRELEVPQDICIGIYMQNRAEWILAEQASYCFSNITVPLYDTLGADTIEYVINQCQLTTIFTSQDKLKNLSDCIEKCPQLRLIVVAPVSPFLKSAGAVDNGASSFPLRVKILSYEQLRSIGASSKQRIPHKPPTPEDLCTICYTSGTTGLPKGAQIPHGAIMSNVGGLKLQGVTTGLKDRYLSYLPLPHIFERMAQAVVVCGGGEIGFFRGDILLLLEDIQEFKPTIFAGVPRLFNRIHGKILLTINQAGGLKKWLFNQGYSAKKEGLKSGTLHHAFWDRILFSKLRQALGGQVRLIVSGSAPISAAVMEFLRIAFSCPVIEGYGMTETCSGGTITDKADVNGFGNVGYPLQSVEIKLVDVPEMNYTSNDVVVGEDGILIPQPRGEVCFRGPGIMTGYYKLPEKTAESIDSDGWLHSGDIGVWLPDQSLKLIDRKKNIFKLAQGEYIAPEKIENVYVRSPFVLQAFVYGNSLEPYLVCVLVLNPEHVLPWAEKHGVGSKSLAELSKLDVLKKAVLKDIVRVSTVSKLNGYEIAKEIHLEPDLFSVENGLLTPSMKLKRKEAYERYKNNISSMYAHLSRVYSSKL